MHASNALHCHMSGWWRALTIASTSSSGNLLGVRNSFLPAAHWVSYFAVAYRVSRSSSATMYLEFMSTVDITEFFCRNHRIISSAKRCDALKNMRSWWLMLLSLISCKAMHGSVSAASSCGLSPVILMLCHVIFDIYILLLASKLCKHGISCTFKLDAVP